MSDNADPCQDIRPDLVAFLDNELDPAGRERVEAHVASCADCAREVSFFQRTWELLDEYQGVEASPDFLHRLVARIGGDSAAPEGARVGWFAYWLPRLAVAAALLVMVGLGRMAWLRMQPEPAAPQLAQLTDEERELIRLLPVLGDERFELVRDLRLVEHLPALQLDDQDLDALGGDR